MQIHCFVSLCKYQFWSHERTHTIGKLHDFECNLESISTRKFCKDKQNCASAIWGLWRIYKCLFIPNCMRKIMWLIMNNKHEKNLGWLKQKKRTRITQSGRNCAIQGTHLIRKQKIWLAIYAFLWSLSNQNGWFVTSFCTELTLFCTVYKKKSALLLTNRNGEIFSCISLGIKQADKGEISTMKK